MTKRRRILQADKIIQNIINVFCLLMFLQLKGYIFVASNPVLLYSTASDVRIVNTSKLSKVNTIVKDLEQGSAVDFHYRKNLVCWSDQSAELIQCMKFNDTYVGEKVKIVSEGLITPTGIAIDWYTDKLYWTDGETNKIEVISIKDKYRKVLFWSEVDLARAIAVVPNEGFMFWTDWGEVPKIERAGMNGNPATRKVIVKDNIIWPNGITVDYDKNLIYWMDAKLHFVDSIDFNGDKRKRVIKGGLVYPYALTFFNDKLYWTDWKTWSIHTWNLSTNGPDIKDLIKSYPVPVDIKVYDESRQYLPSGDHPCNINNGGCSHLCLLSPTLPGYECVCPTGSKLRENSNTTCYDSPQSLLIVAQKSAISKISLDSPDYTPYTLPLKDLKRAITVDFDPKTEYIYWADTLAKTISKARLDGSEQSVVIHSNGLLDSIAIDPLARNIYWTDPVTDTINVARLDGTSKKVIIHNELYDPRAIALHPKAGWMFWSDWNVKKPKIERANLDGSGRLLLVSEKLMWPNGIALDTETNKLYWGDARTHKIEVCNMDGTDRRELHSNDILHIYGVTLLGEHLYWTDMHKRTLDRINKNTGLDRQPVVDQMTNVMGVKAFRLGESPGTNPCSDGNGGCSHLCFNRPDDYVCSCPLGLELSNDRKTCKEPEAFLLYSRKNIIGRLSIEYENNDAILPIKELKEVSALAVHVFGSKLYWSDSRTKTINRCSINGSNMEKVVEWMGLVEGLAIDWSSQNIYWTDTATQRVEVARLDGSSRRALIWQGLKKPKSIVLDPKKGFMYWSELGSKSIKRAAMDGSSPAVFMEQVGRVHALAIDYDKRTLYWAALDPPVIEYAYLNGTGRKILVDDVPMPYTLTLFNDSVFWGDWNTGLIETAKKADGSNRRVTHRDLDYISDLKVYHRSRSAGSNQCGVDNGGCSHLCLPLPLPAEHAADYRCACPAHYRLNRDNLTCSEPEEFLLFAQKNSIGRIFVANGESNDAYIPLTGLKNVRAIEYDPVNKYLYWMEDDSHSIRRVPISYSMTSAVSDSTAFISGLSRPFHMVLDVLGRALYWTCSDTDSINATSIDNNSSVGVILRGDNMMPRHLAFHQTKRLLVWNDVGMGAIMRASVDGTARVELARAANATALALDHSTGTVYWAVNRQIHAVDLDTANERVVWQGGWAASALAVYAGSVYLCGGDRALMRVPLHRRNAPAAPVPHLARLLALLVVHKVPRDHPCWGGGRCGAGAGTCGAGGVCGCGLKCASTPPGPPAAPRCSPSSFLCNAQSPRCLPLEWKCDGQSDCEDGSDEAACEGDACAGGLLRCADGGCESALGACAAGAYCTHKPLPDAFRCDERLCLGARLLCDGVQHCEDGADEAPAACGYTQKDQGGGGTGRQTSALAMCGGAAGAIGAAGGALVAARWWRRRRRALSNARAHALPLCRPKPPAHARQQPLGASSTHDVRFCVTVSREQRTQGLHAEGTDLGLGLIWSSESPVSRYPRPTANPPPSPATASGGGGSGGGGARRRAYRHYRAMNRPPPPTPASTDACESEPEPAARAPPPSPAPPLYSPDHLSLPLNCSTD